MVPANSRDPLHRSRRQQLGAEDRHKSTLSVRQTPAHVVEVRDHLPGPIHGAGLPASLRCGGGYRIGAGSEAEKHHAARCHAA
eukprot:gene5287-biopygen4053